VHLFAEHWTGQAKDVRFHAVPVTGTRATRPVRFAEAVRDLTARETFDCVFSLERTLKQDVYRAGDGVHRVWLERRRQFAPWWKRPFIGRGAFHRNMMALEARTFDLANTRRIIVNSNMVKGEIRRHFQFPEDRIHLVRNGVDVKRFQSGKRTETRAKYGVKDDDVLLLFVGSGWERKGLTFVLRGMKASREMHRLIATLPDSRRDELSRQMSRPIKLLVVGKDRHSGPLQEGVIYAGSMADVENAYAAADLLVMMPIYEPSANVVTEALAAGLPVLTSEQNGAAEIIEEEVNGYVIMQPELSGQILFAIELWLAGRHKRPVPCNSALDLETNIRETVSVLEQAAGEKRA
jgi:UDP-glucose:(heptosyl)LPS alpha-1,3-glucosyltransferase